MQNQVIGFLCAAIAVAALPHPLLASDSQAQPAFPTPEVFAPGVISGPANDGAPTFSPDGKTLFFTRSATHWSVILESHQAAGGSWSTPVVAPFSGQWSDSSPAFSPDGSYLVYVSIRIIPATADKPRQGLSHLWRVNRTATGWSEPIELPVAANAFPAIFRPSVAADGSVYFTASATDKNLSLFRSRFVNGSYQSAEPLAFSDGSVKDVDPEIAPDQSFLVFSSRRTFPGEDQHEHLFLTRQVDGNWTPPVPIRYAGDTDNGSSDDNDPRLAPDLKAVYFSSDRTPPVHFPRTRRQAIEDYTRLNEWDNSNANIWKIALDRI
jgi:Tol biopolymer transport system component